MLRPEDGICRLRRCGICGREESVAYAGGGSGVGETLQVGEYVLVDDIEVGPAVQLSVTSDHASRSMLVRILDGIDNFGMVGLYIPCPCCSESVKDNLHDCQ